MERKRKLPARAARVESVSKKRTSTPPEPRSQPTPPSPIPAVEDALPKSVVTGRPLPTVDEPQPNNLPSKEFQTIAESGVLEESLKRSKQRWLSEGIFELFWKKPVKKKGQVIEPENNPPKECMTKLGTCQITVEPHIFDAQMYSIKDATSKPLPGPASLPPQAMYRPIIQYGPPNGMMLDPTPPPPTPTPVRQDPPQTVQPPPARSQDTHMAHSTPPNNTHGPAPHLNGAGPNSQPHMAQPTAPAQHNPPGQSNGASKSTDPVIQMLAERAATDPDLKSLMRIVANGEATQEQLKRFQVHIDELTLLQKSRQEAAHAQALPHTQPPPPPPTNSAHVNGHGNGLSHPNPQQNSAPVARVTSNPPPPAAKPQHQSQPQYQAQPQALRSKGPVPAAKSDISGIAFEFIGGSGDRYKFPRYSILDFLPHGQVVASFLIVRKGSSGTKYDENLDYYQPITIRLYAHQGKQLEKLQQIVEPVDVVRRYMDEIMNNTIRAEYVLLAMQLPKESIDSTSAEKNENTEMQDTNNQVLWATTNATPLPLIKPVAQIPTEEELYQGFIATVS